MVLHPRLAALLLTAGLSAQTRLLRFPDLHGDQVAFVYGGDLWLARATGGAATRLTSHPGLELFPKFSPDGQWIAFTGQLDGDEQVYVMPAQGGEPRQLTWYPALGPLPDRWGWDNQVLNWTPDGKAIVFRSWRDSWTTPMPKAFTVPMAGGPATALPMPTSGAVDLAPDGKRLVYTPLFRDFRSWKRYQGGWAQDVYLFDLTTHDWQNLSNHVRTDRDPMWLGNRIWFASDRSGTLNLWSYDLQSKALAQETQSQEWDVRWPSAAPDGRIVFELGGELVVLDPKDRAQRKLAIQVPTDGLQKRESRISVERNIEGFDLAPKGERAVVVARGEVFTVPIEHGPTRNLTRSSGAHDKHAAWTPDGKSVVFVSDRSGEEQLWRMDQDGRHEPEALTTDLRALLYAPQISPDGGWVAFGDKDGKLRVLELASRKLTEVADEERGQIRDYTWSPCSGWLAFSKSDKNEMSSVWVWSRAEQKTRRVTTELGHEFAPAWDPKGERLYYLAYRTFAPRIGDVEWNYQLDRMTGVFALALRKDAAALFPPRSDEVKTEPPASQPAPASRKAGEALVIDFDGIADRVETVPVEADNYDGLAAVEGGLVWLREAPFYYGRAGDKPAELHWFDLKERKVTAVGEGVGAYALSTDGKKLLVRESGKLFLQDAGAGGKAGRKTVSTAGLTMERVPAEEWTQIFDEVWRRYRDFFYVANMHGFDWEALRAFYRPLVAQAGHRQDVNYVIAEMIAELNVGHAYIAGGDWERPERVPVALPGARFELDPQSGRYRIARILRGENDTALYRSPLTEVGVDIKEGDYVLAIAGRELRKDEDPYRALRGLSSHPVAMTVHNQPTIEGAREVIFRPLTSEKDLLYWEWVTRNRNRVSELSQGRIGYLHLPNMGAEGIREFIRWFYVQRDKEALVIDDRANGGGNVSQMIIERLRRELVMGTFGRTTGFRAWPTTVFNGPLVCLLNQNSASDGDIFPAMFRRLKLGKLVGKRSWGGIIGITDRGTLVDGGTVNVPEFGNTELGGEWTIEGHGVDPDVEVENDPKAVLAGRDPQLEKGVEILLDELQRNQRPKPVRPPEPNRSGR